MGIERLDDGDDPTPPADADPSKDADRSEEVASSSDVRRAEDQTPDSPRRESPEGVVAKQAEPRTRDEYADHLAPPNSSPIDEDPTQSRDRRAESSEDDFRAAVSPGHGHAEELHLAEEPDEQRGVEEQAHSNSPAALGEKQGDLSAPAVEAAQPHNESTEPTDKHEVPHHDAATNSGLDTGTESDDDVGRERDDRSEPPAVGDLEGLPSDAPPTQETADSENPEAGLTPSPNPTRRTRPKDVLPLTARITTPQRSTSAPAL